MVRVFLDIPPTTRRRYSTGVGKTMNKNHKVQPYLCNNNMEELIFRIIPDNNGLFSRLIWKLVSYFPDALLKKYQRLMAKKKLGK